MRAFIVSVDYHDLLAVTLKYNRHHFNEVWVVTTERDAATREVALENRAKVFATDVFYANGAKFNKWAALEAALDYAGRDGWICVMDADVLWPKDVRFYEQGGPAPPGGMKKPPLRVDLVPGKLYTPQRRMAPWPLPSADLITRIDPADAPVRSVVPLVPKEESWGSFPVHHNRKEWAGYTQIFHASDPVLGPPPWHDVRWTHCGGADSFFQAKWARPDKIRPPFECLHLGENGVNWFGRASRYADGTEPDGAAERRELSERIWDRRRRNRLTGRDQFEGERLPG